MNEYFVPGAVPAPNSPGASATIRAEFSSIATAFDKLPVLAGSANEFVVVNATGTAMIASGYLFTDFVTVTGAQTLTNKTLAWADNTWPGFGSAATKVAGTGAGNVLLLAENAKLPALDGSLLTNLTPAAIGIIPVVNGGTGAATVPQARINLGIDLKADANNAVLTGAPTCPTPPVGNSSARLANTQFVTDTITAIGAAIPSDATPLMNGVAAAGAHTFVSRDDHVHPVDTSRAPAAASTATGTSFSPVGGIVATNVQAALSELDTEKAPLASPALTGVPTSTTPLTSDNSTRIATTAFMQSLLAQQPPGVEVSDSAPLMNGVVAPGTGVEASRYDHVHPTDTSRAPITSPSFTGTLTHSGDVVLSGSGKRITGDFTNSTVANRVMFQTNVVDGASGVVVAPNGINKGAVYGVVNNSDPANAAVGELRINSAEVRLASARYGTGTYLPMTFHTGGTERMRIGTNGAVSVGVPGAGFPLEVHKGTVTGPNDVLAIAPEGGALGRESRIIFGSTLSTGWGGADYDVRYSGAIGYGSTGGPDPRDTALKFYTSDLYDVPTERMRIDNNGRVGIGRSPTDTALEVAGIIGVFPTAGSSEGGEIHIYNHDEASTGLVIDSTVANVGRIFNHGAILIGQLDNIGGGDVVFYTDGKQRLAINGSGNVRVTSPAGLGYGPGAGGTVTQATSKSTAVTLNKPCGRITMHNASLAAGATVGFVFNNSVLGADDVLLLNTAVDGSIVDAFSYQVYSFVPSAGVAIVYVKNVSAGALSEVVQLNFAIIKGATY